MQRRGKWITSPQNMKINTLLLLKEDCVPPLQWTLGRVIAVHPGKDGIVRVAIVKTSTGEFKRSIAKLCPLPIENEEEE